MLKKFIFNSLSAFVGAWLAIVLLGIGFVILIIGLLNSTSPADGMEIKPHSVLKINLEGGIDETESSDIDYLSLLEGDLEETQTLQNLLQALDYASSTKDIDALYIECGGASASPATLNALRNGILDFKKSGKRVFAYGDNLTMGDYFVATAADVVYLNPAGSLDLQGISGTSLYFKGLLDKLGIEVEAVRVGSFKSAVEPYTSAEMSDSARLQLEQLYGNMWNFITQEISQSRNVSIERIDSAVNKFIFLNESKVAEKVGLIDKCLYYREVSDIIGNYIGVNSDEINFVKPDAFLTPNFLSGIYQDNQIAVVYAVGEIGEYPGAGIDCHTLVPIIVKLANESKVKGMVLRVNSPGGSVFGSEQIGEALDYFKSKGKPLAVSMGDYAASGGYWISCGADVIFADPLTITGSIGIFGLVPNVSKLVKNIGISPQTVSTNPGVNFPSIFYPMTPSQHEALQMNVERGYEKFISRVAEGRGLDKEKVKRIAEGRVWDAMKAKEIGLVDSLGGTDDAINWVITKKGLDNANIVYYPEQQDNLFKMLASSVLKNAAVDDIIDNLSDAKIGKKSIRAIRWILNQNHVQARSPYYKLSLK